MTIKEWIIKKLEKDVETTAGHGSKSENVMLKVTDKLFGFDFKKKLLSYLRGTRKELPSR